MTRAQPGKLPSSVVVAPAAAVFYDVTATGTVWRRRTQLSMEVGGTLGWIAGPGHAVKQGEVIARLRMKALTPCTTLACRCDASDAIFCWRPGDRARLGLAGGIARSQLDEAVSRRAMTANSSKASPREITSAQSAARLCVRLQGYGLGG